MIKHRKRISALLAALAISLLSGCASKEPIQFYQLQSNQPVANEQQQSLSVLLGPLKVADYLQRESILQRDADGSLSMAKGGRWAGSLQDNIGQYVLRQLAGELKTSKISLYPDRIGVKAQQQVVLTISRLDSGAGQPAVIEAQWRVLDQQGELLDSNLYQDTQPHNGSLSSQVMAQSLLLERLTKALSKQMLQQQTQQKVVVEQPRATPTQTVARNQETNTKTPVKGRATPAALPEVPVLKKDKNVEVFRF